VKFARKTAVFELAARLLYGWSMTSSTSLRIVIADHQTIFREGLKRLLETEPGISVVGATGDATEAVRLVRELQPDVLLLELAMTGGLDVLKRLVSTQVKALALTAHADKNAIMEALHYGVRGVVLKESPTELLFKSIRKVAENQYWIGRDDVAMVIEAMRTQAQQAETAKRVDRFRLTPREMDIVEAVAAGESNKGIAQRLKLSEDTVKHHISNVFDKLGVFSRLELALFAINHQLVSETQLAS
jgi:two-component system, NarL family, nitrate/nitrite response regulator NarL